MLILTQVRAVIGQPQASVYHILLNYCSEVETIITEQWESFNTTRTVPGDYNVDSPYLAALAYGVMESETGVTAEWAIKALGGLTGFSGGLKSVLWGDAMSRQGRVRYAHLLDLGWIVEVSGRVEFTDILLRHHWAAKQYATFWRNGKNDRTFTPPGTHFGKLDPVLMGYIGQLADSKPEKCVKVFREFITKDPHFALTCLMNGFDHDETEVIEGLLSNITWEKDNLYLAAAWNQIKAIGSRCAVGFENALVQNNQHPCALLFAAQILGVVGTSDQVPRLRPVLKNPELGCHTVRVFTEKIQQLEAEKMSDEEYKALTAAKIAGTGIKLAALIFQASVGRGANVAMNSLQAKINRQKQIRRELAELETKKQEELTRRNAILPQIHTALQKSFAQMAGRAPVLQTK